MDLSEWLFRLIFPRLFFVCLFIEVEDRIWPSPLPNRTRHYFLRHFWTFKLLRHRMYCDSNASLTASPTVLRGQLQSSTLALGLQQQPPPPQIFGEDSLAHNYAKYLNNATWPFWKAREILPPPPPRPIIIYPHDGWLSAAYKTIDQENGASQQQNIRCFTSYAGKLTQITLTGSFFHCSHP